MKKVICVIILTVIITFGGFLCLRSNKSTRELCNSKISVCKKIIKI